MLNFALRRFLHLAARTAGFPVWKFGRIPVATITSALLIILAAPMGHADESSQAVDAAESAAGAPTVPDTAAEQAADSEQTQHVVIVVGAEGRAEFAEVFRQWADRWQTAASQGNAAVSVIGLQELAAGETATDESEAVVSDSQEAESQASDLKALEQLLRSSLAQRTPEPLWLVLIGHGTFDGRSAKFNLRGPDLSAEDLQKLLTDARRPIAVINCASSSAPFINQLSGPDRIVISATKDGNEFQFARFGDYLSLAVGSLQGDLNRDGQTSLLEAWLFAAAQVQQFYESEGRLATEHSLLDDNGDQLGTRFEVFDGVRIKDSNDNKESVDGRLARRFHLIRSPEESRLTPRQRQQRDELEEKLEQLRQKRDQLPEADYLRQLEELLVPLARIYDHADKAFETEESDPGS
jgi:hypothetical protein